MSAPRTMNELSLFTGAGGGILGSKLLGWETIGYVEWDKYCQQVIAARIADGCLPIAPIFGDVREFVQSGAAAEYRGFTDVVSGGFPCQPFSVAGKRNGADDSRNMWPATIATIRAVEPRYAFLENVPGLLASGYFGTILGDLAESGYDVRWRILSAAELGAPHLRKRLWIVAHSQSERESQFKSCASRREGQRSETIGTQFGAGSRGARGDSAEGIESHRRAPTEVSQIVAHAFERTRQPSFTRTGERALSCSDEAGDGEVADADSAGRGEQWRAVPGEEAIPASQLNRWWEVEPDVGRVADGVASRVDRLRAIGNGQVPAVAAAAWMLLTGEL